MIMNYYKFRDTEHYDYPQLSLHEDIKSSFDFQQHLKLMSLSSLNQNATNAIYIHIPFCAQFCIFCNYYKELYNPEIEKNLVSAICKEIALYSSLLPDSFKKISAIHFGGGTPSLLKMRFYDEIVNIINRSFHLVKDFQLSIEGNVRDFSNIDYLRDAKQVGINRFSFGIQSLSEKIRKMYFLPDKINIYKTVNNMSTLGISDYNADLMFNFPEQNPSNILSDINECFDYGINCLDLYALNVFPNTHMEKYLIKNNMYSNYKKI